MKLILRVLLLLLLVCFPVDAAIALVQHTNFNQTSNVSSQALAYGSNNASGGFGAVCVRAGNKSTVLSVTDNNSNSWASVVSVQITGTGNGELLQCFEAHNLNAGANTVTVSTTISTTLRFALFEYSGCATASPIDGSNSNTGSSSSLASNSITPGANNELIISAGSVDAAETYTAGTNFTMEEVVPAAPSKLGVEDWIQTTATTTTGPMTISGSDSWGAVVFAVKVVSGAAAPLKPPVVVKGESHEKGIRTSVRFDRPAYLGGGADLEHGELPRSYASGRSGDYAAGRPSVWVRRSCSHDHDQWY